MAADAGPTVPSGVEHAELQSAQDGAGPLFHRRYVTRIREPRLPARELIGRIISNPDVASSTEFATFKKTSGSEGRMRVGDEYIVGMSGPWTGRCAWSRSPRRR
jgi:hypothetical protein